MDFNIGEVDIIKVDLDWVRGEMYDEIDTDLSPTEWEALDDSEKLEHFLWYWCQYSPDNIQYIVNPSKINQLTYKDFN